MATILIEDISVSNREKKIEPLRVKFPHCNGQVKKNITAFQSGLFSDSLAENEYVAICQTDGVCYMGSTKGENKKENQKLYIALKNNISNKVKLIEVSKISVSPVVQCPPSTNPVLLDTNEGTTAESTRDFVHRFGMLRGQRLYDQAERLTVKAETVRANLESAAVGSNVKDIELIVPKNSDSLDIMIPPRKHDASQASEVYCIEDIIPNADLEKLDSIAKKLLEDDSCISEVEGSVPFSIYFIKEFNSLKNAKNLFKESKLKNLKALLYTEGLIKLSTLKDKIVSKVMYDANLSEVIPESVKQNIRRKFTSTEKPTWLLTKMCQERTICHAIVLALVIGNCSVDAHTLSLSLKTDVNSLDPLIRVIGARLVKDKLSEEMKIVLTLPLATPLFKRGPMKKKGKK